MFVILLEIFLSLVRITLLFTVALLTYILGDYAYIAINHFLYSINSPCLQIIALLVVIVPTVALFYGIHVKKYFWQRQNHYNFLILLVSFIVGVILTMIPVNILTASGLTSTMACPEQQTTLGVFLNILSTGLITALLGFIGVDIGVTLKAASHHLTTSNSPSSSKKTTKKKKRR